MTRLRPVLVLLAVLSLPDMAGAQSGAINADRSDNAAIRAAAGARPSARQIEVKFLTGLRALEQGRPQTSIREFTEILAIDPRLVRVRLELARAYFAAEQWKRSREEFFAVLSGDLPDPVRFKVLGFIRAIDARRGFESTLSFGITSTGDRRRYDSDQIRLNFGGLVLPFEIDRDAQSRLGIRIAGAARVQRPVDLGFGERITSTVFAGGFFNLLDAPGTSSDDYQIGLRGGLRLASATSTYSIAPVYSQRYVGGHHYENQLGLELNFESRTPLGLSVFGFASYSDLDNKRFADRDGDLARLELGVRKSVGGRGSIGVSLLAEDKNVDFNLDNYRSYRAKLFAIMNLPYGLTAKPSVFWERKTFGAPNALFSASPDEDSWGARLRIEKGDFLIGGRFSPFVEAGYQRTRSDIAAFSFRKTDFEFGLERKF